MTRSYTLKKRAQKQAETRKKIVEAAVDLHSEIGPARTTFSMIADRAGVQRHTLYAHFPDERALGMACSGLVHERDPLPEASDWEAIKDRKERLTKALSAIYGWYGRNAALMSCLMRDIEYHAITQEIVDMQISPVIRGWHEILGNGLNEEQRAMLHLALSFFTWRTLSQDCWFHLEKAVEAMVRTVEAA